MEVEKLQQFFKTATKLIILSQLRKQSHHCHIMEIMHEYYAICIRNHLVFPSFPILNNFKYVDIEDRKSTQHDWGISLQFCLAISFQIRILFLVSYIAKSELAGYRKNNTIELNSSWSIVSHVWYLNSSTLMQDEKWS